MKLRPLMNRTMHLAALGVCFVVALAAPATATTPVPGATVEVEDCFYSYLLGGSWWSIECRYRIDGGEWRRASQEGTSGQPEMQLSGTSVTAQVVDRRVVFSAAEDVASLRVGSRRVK
jgi:hypothetical protein